MPQELSEHLSWKEFSWESSRSVEDLKKYIKYYCKTSCLDEQKFASLQQEKESLKHDLAVREGYEKACEKIQNELVQVFSLARMENEVVLPGTQIEYPTDGFWDHPDGIILLNKAVEQNIEKLKPVMEKWLEQELQAERETTQQALTTSQTWHERQKAEIIAEWKAKYTNLLNSRQEKVSQEISLIKEALND